MPEEYDYFPAVKLHYIGVDSRYRNLGYGKYILAEAFNTVQKIVQYSGCNFITVEALPNSIRFYEKYGFVVTNKASEYYNMLFKISEL